MSHLKLLMGILSASASGVVTVSGESIFATSGSGPVVVKLIINPDGTLDKDENGVITQIDASTDWIIPNGSASSDYQVRFINKTGTISGSGTTLTEDVWSPIDQVHEIVVRRTGIDGNGQTIASFDLQIRLNTGSVLDTGSYTQEAEIT